MAVTVFSFSLSDSLQDNSESFFYCSRNTETKDERHEKVDMKIQWQQKQNRIQVFAEQHRQRVCQPAALGYCLWNGGGKGIGGIGGNWPCMPGGGGTADGKTREKSVQRDDANREHRTWEEMRMKQTGLSSSDGGLHGGDEVEDLLRGLAVGAERERGQAGGREREAGGRCSEERGLRGDDDARGGRGEQLGVAVEVVLVVRLHGLAVLPALAVRLAGAGRVVREEHIAVVAVVAPHGSVCACVKKK